MSADSPNPYGPDKPCLRTACVENGPADHLGGAHLDPADRARYDGIGILFGASPNTVRAAVTPLLLSVGSLSGRPADGDTALRATVEVAVVAALREIDQLRGQVAHVQVDRDRQVREASRRALDCEAHGEIIRETEKQVAHFDASAEKHNKGRLALLGFLNAVDDFVSGYDKQVSHGQDTPSAVEIVEALRKASKKAHAAHTRAWS